MQAGYKRLLRSDRGNALLLAVLIILALTSVGVVSVQRTNTDLMVAANVSRSTQAFLCSDAGMQHAIALVRNNTQGYLDAIRHQNEPANNLAIRTYPIVDATTAALAMPDPIAAPKVGDPQTQNLWLSTVDSGNTTARMLQDIAYRVTASYVSQESGESGNSSDAKICHQVWDVNSQCGIPTRLESVSQTMNQTDTVVVMSRSRTQTGPCKCMYRY
jgi:Tfp pilus assembly protein PilX